MNLIGEITTGTLIRSGSALPGKLAGMFERLRRLTRRTPRRLRLCESLPLGERRFVAVVEFEAERFLLGGTASSLVLLSRLDHNGTGDLKPGTTPQDSTNPGMRRGATC